VIVIQWFDVGFFDRTLVRKNDGGFDVTQTRRSAASTHFGCGSRAVAWRTNATFWTSAGCLCPNWTETGEGFAVHDCGHHVKERVIGSALRRLLVLQAYPPDLMSFSSKNIAIQRTLRRTLPFKERFKECFKEHWPFIDRANLNLQRQIQQLKPWLLLHARTSLHLLTMTRNWAAEGWLSRVSCALCLFPQSHSFSRNSLPTFRSYA